MRFSKSFRRPVTKRFGASHSHVARESRSSFVFGIAPCSSHYTLYVLAAASQQASSSLLRTAGSPQRHGRGHACAREIFVATTGDDWNAGTVEAPFATIRRALDAAKPGDTITLKNGVYEGGINIDIDNLTIRSAPGEWAVIESPLTQFTDGHANSVIRYNFDVQGASSRISRFRAATTTV